MKGVTAEPAKPRALDATEGLSKARWERELLEPALQKAPERDVEFTTISGRPVDRLYTPEDVAGLDYARDVNHPGQFPYTRGIHPTGYRGKLWTMRQFAGFGTPEETNERYKTLLRAGGTGLSVAFDLPTLMGRDPDDELSLGEVGKCGVSIVSLADMERLFDGIRLADITTSMTINSPASMIFAMYLVVAEKQGADWSRLSGTIQNDILKEFIAQKEYIYPPRESMRLVTDVFTFCSKEVPRWNTVSVSGYHIREAGSTSLQELAFTLRDGIEYVQYGIDAGLDVDDFAPRISFFFNSHSDFFEEIAKFRAARKIWAEVMRDRFKATQERSWKLRFHTQTAGVSLTAQQPYNNVVRTALQALAAVMGGTNSLHTNSLDEALSLPTAEAATLALRTQQIIAHESGVTNVVDPLGGSYFVERLTADMERGAKDYFAIIDRMGGMVEAIQEGFRRERSPRPPTGSSRPSNSATRSSSASTSTCSRTSRRFRSFTSTTRPRRSSSAGSKSCADRATTIASGSRSMRCGTPRAVRPIRCTLCSSASAPTRPSAKCATRCATSGASTRKCR